MFPCKQSSRVSRCRAMSSYPSLMYFVFFVTLDRCPFPEGYTCDPGLNMCYKIVLHPLAISLAEDACCTADGRGHLLVIDSMEKHNFIMDVITNLAGTIVHSSHFSCLCNERAVKSPRACNKRLCYILGTLHRHLSSRSTFC